MRQMKRCFAMLLAVAMVMTSLPQMVFAQEMTDLTEKSQLEGEGSAVPDAEQEKAGLEIPSQTESGQAEAGEDSQDETQAEDKSEDSQADSREGLAESEERQKEKTQTAIEPHPEELQPEESQSGESQSKEPQFEEPQAGEPQPEEEKQEDAGAVEVDPDEMIEPQDMVEEYTFLTAGQKLHHREAGGKQYAFKPDETGWYMLSGESKAGCVFSLQLDQVRYMEGETEIIRDRYFSTSGTSTRRIVWLNKADTYFFGCYPQEYDDESAIDIALEVRTADITRIEAVSSPKDTSFDYVDLGGTQVKIHFSDGTFVEEEIRCGYQDYLYTFNYLDIFQWGNSQVASRPGECIYSTVEIQKIDNATVGGTTLEGVDDGKHTVEAVIKNYSDEVVGTPFKIDFEVQRESVQSIEVIDPRTDYTEGFREDLEKIRIRVTYNEKDGRKPEEIESVSNSGIRQYLLYQNANEESCKTYNIDTWLKEGGNKAGPATVQVKYKNQTTSYEIQIREFPYESLTVSTEKKVYYTDCSCENPFISGEMVDNRYFSGTLVSKDGTVKEYAHLYELPDLQRGGLECGFLLRDGETERIFSNVDDYVAAGGAIGACQVKISYLDLEATCEVEIRENPYDRIEVMAEPQKTYLHSSPVYWWLNLQGLVIRAYKKGADNGYDEYTYNEAAPDGGISDWMSYFSYSLGGHNSSEYLEVGTHTVYLQFMGKTAEYTIDVVEKLAEKLEIFTAPETLEYYVGENGVEFWGMVLELTDLNGAAKRYKYEDYSGSSGEYESWDDISGNLQYDTSAVDWEKPGTYPVTVSCLGVSDTFDITVEESPVSSLEVLRDPVKMNYFRYEGSDFDLNGLKCRVTFSDGTVTEVEAHQYDSSLYIPYQGRGHYLRSSWLKRNSSGQPTLGENAFKLEYLGKECRTGTIQVKQDPIQSMKLVKEPEKAELCRFGIMDLYGAEVRITYVGGQTKDVKVAEHTSRVTVEDAYGETLWASLDWYNTTLVIYYMNQSVGMDVVKSNISSLDSAPLQNESMQEVVLTRENPYQIYAFTPEKTAVHYFYITGDAQFFLYEGNQLLRRDEAYEGIQVQSELTAGTTYYCVLSMSDYTYMAADPESVNARFGCSSQVSDLSDLPIRDFAVTKVPRDTWYDFESQSISLEDGWDLKGTGIRLTYENGWVEDIDIEDWGSSIILHGQTLSVAWKYTRQDEGETYVENRKDNALVYTLGEMTKDVPMHLDVESPVASIKIANDPFAENPVYQYQMEEGQYNLAGLNVSVQYKDGRTDGSLIWKMDDDGICEDPRLDGYRAGTSVRAVEDEDGDPTGEYVLNVQYMGASTGKTLTVRPNPIKDIQVLKVPEKMMVYPYEEREVDLYGLKLLLTYQDGQTTNVQVDSHESWLKVEDKYGAELQGRVRNTYNDDEEVENAFLYISYMGLRKDVGEYAKKPIAETPELADIRLGESKEITLDASRRYQVYRFVPEMSGTYTFEAGGGDDYDTYAEIYSASDRFLDDDHGEGSHFKLVYTMVAGKTYYLVAGMLSAGETGTFTCTLKKGEDTSAEPVDMAELSLEPPTAGMEFPEYYAGGKAPFSIASTFWYGNEDGLADYGTSYRVKLTLVPDTSSYFKSGTQVTVNGKKVNEKSVSSDGRMTVYYTFPSTDCKIILPELEGYTLDLSGNEKPDSVSYGGFYRFRYVKTGDARETLIVKGNDQVLTADADGTYVLQPVKENITVYVKTTQVAAEKEKSVVTLHNRDNAVFDILTGKKGRTLAENESGEKTFPTLNSYVDGSDEFFYGWYLENDGDSEKPNGKGTRFTSKSVLEKEAYELYAKWASGIFTKVLNFKTVNCKVLSIDEDNRLKVQIKDCCNAASRKVLMRGMQMFAADGAGVLEIPATFPADGTDLEVDQAECEVVAIAEKAFAGDTEIKAVVIPDTVESIGEGAFSGCSELEEVTIPGSVTEIAENTFSNCASLKTVAIPEGVSEIKAGAFEGCGNLETVVLPDTIETIEEGAFTVNGDTKPTLLCSSAIAQSKAVENVRDVVAIQTVDIVVNYDVDEMEFVYDDEEKAFTAGVEVDKKEVSGRMADWTYTDTDAYEFKESGNTLTVKPLRVTHEDEVVRITATDAASKKAKTMVLRTKAADLEDEDGDGDPIYGMNVEGADGLVYTGKAICPKVTVTRTGGKMVEPENYDVSYEDNVNAGTAYITVTGKGNYNGTLTASFVIQKKVQVITASDVKKKVGDQPFSLGAGADGGGTLSYSSNNPSVVRVDASGLVTVVDAGTAVITIRAAETANYKEATRTVTVTVERAADPSGNSGSQTPPDGNGGNQKPSTGNDGNQKPSTGNGGGQKPGLSGNNGVKAKDPGLRVSRTSYSKAYGSKAFSLGATAQTSIRYKSSNTKVAQVNAKGKVTVKNCGKAIITITASGSGYTAAVKTVTVQVVPKKAKILSVKSKKAGQLSVSWKRQKEADGYLIEYTTDKKFKKTVKKSTVKKNKTTTVTLKKLKKGKKYYVRVKAYKTIDKKKVCGSASKSVTKNVKKK